MCMLQQTPGKKGHKLSLPVLHNRCGKANNHRPGFSPLCARQPVTVVTETAPGGACRALAFQVVFYYLFIFSFFNRIPWTPRELSATEVTVAVILITGLGVRCSHFSTLLILSFTPATSVFVLRGTRVLVRRIRNVGTLRRQLRPKWAVKKDAERCSDGCLCAYRCCCINVILRGTSAKE